MTVDVLVSGAGIVGLATARTFAAHGHKTLLIDRADSSDTQGRFGVDLRTLALSPAMAEFLTSLDVILPPHRANVDSMHIWERDGSASITMTAEAVNKPHLAHVYEHRDLAAALDVSTLAAVDVNLNAWITAVDADSRTVRIEGIGELRPRLLVVAEGSTSSTRDLLKVNLEIDQNLGQQALATVVQTEQPHDNVAWQIFGPTPLALLPMARSDLLSLIWSVPDPRARQLAELDDDAFMGCLNRACETVAGKVVAADRRVRFPLNQRLISDFNPHPWVLLLGDAAHTLHPLAGQGVNLGLEDVRAVNHVLQRRPSHLSKPGIWREFNTKRKLRAMSMLRLMSFFSNVYAWESPYLRLLRNLGVRLVNESNGLKRQLIHEAMGIGPIASVL